MICHAHKAVSTLSVPTSDLLWNQLPIRVACMGVQVSLVPPTRRGEGAPKSHQYISTSEMRFPSPAPSSTAKQQGDQLVRQKANATLPGSAQARLCSLYVRNRHPCIQPAMAHALQVIDRPPPQNPTDVAWI